jgi:hypothetical protein
MDTRFIDPIEKIRQDFLNKIKEDKEKKQRLCIHKWFHLSKTVSVCLHCEKVNMLNR